MSSSLILFCSRSISLRTILSNPLRISQYHVLNFSTKRSPYSSLKPSFGQNPFREPTDEKSRRLKMQEHIRFREKYHLENEYELIYAMPRERMYGLMHFVCTCACVTMLVFIVVQFHRDMLDLEPVFTNPNGEIPQYVLNSIAAIVGTAFGAVLLLIARMPVRLYYSRVRHSYALFYHPFVGVFRKKKVIFRNDQYRIVPQKLDEIDGAQRSVKIRIEFGQGLLRLRNSFYLIEQYFRSKRDIRRLRFNDIENDEEKIFEEKPKQAETDIWQTVVEKKDQTNVNQRRRTMF